MLICPKCKIKIPEFDAVNECSASLCCFDNRKITIVSGKPVLINFDESILDKSSFINKEASTLVPRTKNSIWGYFRKIIYWRGINITKQAINTFSHYLIDNNKSNKPKVLIIGGATMGIGIGELYATKQVDIISFDIYASTLTDFIADAHQIPVEDCYFDGVIIQSVLEHVLSPQLVVDEIFRVLKPNGIVYSDTPFMQQIHEGAYDFSRFTNSGHRWLFRRFELLSAGPVFGPSIALIWTIKYFTEAIIRNKKISTMISFCFIWLTLIDFLIPREYAEKMASSFYFMGKKGNTVLLQNEIVKYYKGN